ncbi:MAG TPA: sigma 54-interacting transcriptional regulator [Polyangiaceae bacterium]|nr:sigma 54-interacting transcriptional regulator [Polyangiaceae bacterium]
MAHRAHLVLVHGEPRDAVVEFGARGATIGRRAEGSQVEVGVADSLVSRQHVRVEPHGAGWRLQDLGSRNGGFVDGAPFKPGASVALAPGAVIRVGDTLFVFRPEARALDQAETCEAFPGISNAAAAVRRRLCALAGATGHVLVVGETGTGKERVARWLGRPALQRPFVPHNCAELSKELGRSELFGYARGAFSGATKAKRGLIDAAHDGVLFLDEFGELPWEVQGELLRFLEDGSYRPVGATELRTSPARVVAATNVVLDDAVRAGHFRRDLLARLRAVNLPLELPPLRERREDILLWAKFFLTEALAAPHPPEPWQAGLAECLLLHAWPENLRELRGVIRSLVEAREPWPWASNCLPDRVLERRQTARASAPGPTPSAAGDGRDTPAVPVVPAESVEPTRDEVVRALTETRGCMVRTSSLLGVDRRKLYRLCKKHEVNVNQFRSGE